MNYRNYRAKARKNKGRRHHVTLNVDNLELAYDLPVPKGHNLTFNVRLEQLAWEPDIIEVMSGGWHDRKGNKVKPVDVVQVNPTLAQTVFGVDHHVLHVDYKLRTSEFTNGRDRQEATKCAEEGVDRFIKNAVFTINDEDWILMGSGDSKQKEGEYYLCRASDKEKLNFLPNLARFALTYLSILFTPLVRGIKVDPELTWAVGESWDEIPGFNHQEWGYNDLEIPDGCMYMSYNALKKYKHIRGTQIRLVQANGMMGKGTIVTQKGISNYMDAMGIEFLIPSHVIKNKGLDPKNSLHIGVIREDIGLRKGGGSGIASFFMNMVNMEKQVLEHSIKKLGFNLIEKVKEAVNPELPIEESNKAFLKVMNAVDTLDMNPDEEEKIIDLADFSTGMVSGGYPFLSDMVYNQSTEQALLRKVSKWINNLGLTGLGAQVAIDPRLDRGQVCINSLPDGMEVVIGRFPIRHVYSFYRAYNKKLSGAPAQICVNIHDWLELDGDVDGDMVFAYTNKPFIQGIKDLRAKFDKLGLQPYDALEPNGLGYKGEKHTEPIDQMLSLMMSNIIHGLNEGTLSIGVATYAMLGALKQGHYEIAREFSLMMQLSVMSFKHNIVEEDPDWFDEITSLAYEEYVDEVPNFIRAKRKLFEQGKDMADIVERDIPSVIYDMVEEINPVLLDLEKDDFVGVHDVELDCLRDIVYQLETNRDRGARNLAHKIRRLVYEGTVENDRDKIIEAQGICRNFRDPIALASWLVALAHGHHRNKDQMKKRGSAGSKALSLLPEESLFVINQAFHPDSPAVFQMLGGKKQFRVYDCLNHWTFFKDLGNNDAFLKREEDKDGQYVMLCTKNGEHPTDLPVKVMGDQDEVDINILSYNWASSVDDEGNIINAAITIKNWHIA